MVDFTVQPFQKAFTKLCTIVTFTKFRTIISVTRKNKPISLLSGMLLELSKFPTNPS